MTSRKERERQTGFARRLSEGVDHHRAGRLKEAEQRYRWALALKPGDPDALHHLGVIALQRGDNDEAIELIGRALATRPAQPPMLSDLGAAQRAAGQLEAAEKSCRQALALDPGYPEAQVNLATVLFDRKRFAEAEAAVRAALALRPTFPEGGTVLADALREQGRLSEAETAYRHVLAYAAEHWPAVGNLGWMLVQLGRMEEGLALCRRAVTEADPPLQARQNLVRVLLEYGEIDEAMAVLEQAIERWPNVPYLSVLIGTAWQQMGEFGEARDWLQRASVLDETLLEARVRLAEIEADVDNHEGAVEILDAVLEREPRRFDALLAKARSLLSLGDVDGAVAIHRETIERYPEFAIFHAALGRTLSSAGDLTGAVAAQRRAIELNPRSVPAYAGLLTTLRGKASDSERDAALKLLDLPWMTDERRSSLQFGLAAYYDGKGEWEAAARSMVEANRRRKSADERRYKGYAPEQYEAFIDRVIDTFTPELFERLRGFGSTSERPVFIVGMPRSGTTLTEQIIASHPAAHGAGERPFARQSLSLLPAIMGRPGSDPLRSLAGADAATLQAAADWHLGRLAALDGGKALRAVDKMPDNYSLLGWLAVLFPRARFIYCRRDLRDVALSCWTTNFSEIRWANDLDHLARRIRQHQRVMDHWRKVLPVPLLEVDYEAMVNDQEGQSRRLIDWLGLDWDERCMAFYQTERLVRTASVAQVREPIYRRSLARWEHYATMLSPLLDAILTPD